MKPFLFLLPFFACVIDSKAQSGADKDYTPSELNTKFISLNAKENTGSTRLPFDDIRVIDSRYDTSKVGFMNNYKSGKNAYKKLRFRKGLSVAVADYLNEFYGAGSDKTGTELLIVIKKFWLGRSVTNAKERPDGIDFYLGWEMYVSRGDKYLPYKRLDTVINIEADARRFANNTSEDSSALNIRSILKNIISVYDFTSAINVIGQRETKTLAQIEAYNDKRFQLPVLMESTHPHGVFTDFQQFVQNKPGISTFKKEKMRYATFKKAEYITDSTGANIVNYWAYADEGVLRKGKSDNVILHRIGNTFEYFILDTETQGGRTNVSPYSSGAGIPLGYTRDVWIPFQIDMETGKAY